MPSFAPLRDLADTPTAPCAPAAAPPFAALTFLCTHLVSCAYDAERRGDAAGPEPAPAVLFRARLSGAAPPAARCPEALSRALRAPVPDAEARAIAERVVALALECLSARGGGAAAEAREDAESSSSFETAPQREWFGAYSSEDSATAPGGEACQRIAGNRRASAQDAQAALQFLLSAAFSCPCAPLSYAVQLALASELERAAPPHEACGGVLRCLTPLVDAPHGGSFVFVVNGIPVEAYTAEACTAVSWFARPLPAAALPVLVRSVEHAADMRALRSALAWGAAGSNAGSAAVTPALPTQQRRTSTRPRAALCKARSASPTTHSESSLSTTVHSPWLTSDALRRRELLSALCGCELLMPHAVSVSRRELLYQLFSETGEVPQYYTLLSAHPELLRAHHNALHYVFFEEGPLPIADRLMVALIAASRQKCEYLVARFAALLTRFVDREAKDTADARGSGEEGCLLHGPPPHIQAIRHFIAVAAHVPWLINEEVVRTAMAAGWGVPGLIQVVCILAETLSLCSFVMGMFVPKDPWTLAALPAPLAASFSACPPEGEHVHTSSVDFARYTGEDDIVSENRIKKPQGRNSCACWSRKFNWHDHGGTVMEQYYPGAAALINSEFDAFSVIVGQLNQADCVGLTSPEYTPTYAFRSLQIYVQNIIGFIADDYPYHSINKVLRRPAKWFAQSCTMRPETLTSSQVRLWASCRNEGSESSPMPPQGPQQSQPQQLDNVEEQERQIIATLNLHKGPFTLSMHPSSSFLSGIVSEETTAVEEPTQEVTLEALQLHEERLLFLIALATMEARKEGLLAVLLHPMWLNLNNM